MQQPSLTPIFTAIIIIVTIIYWIISAGYYEGIIDSYDTSLRLFQVVFSDGDKAEYNRTEVQSMLKVVLKCPVLSPSPNISSASSDGNGKREVIDLSEFTEVDHTSAQSYLSIVCQEDIMKAAGYRAKIRFNQNGKRMVMYVMEDSDD